MLVRATGLGHAFPGQPALFEHLDLLLQPGEVVAVQGASGSGKSTLLSILAGWLQPTTGTVHCEEVTRTSWVFQNPHGVAARTALDHIVLPLLAAGLTRREGQRRATDLLGRFSLDEVGVQPFRELSGGQAQRLMLARAVAADPDLLLVDEPTAQLDPVSSAEVIDVLAGLASDGTIVVIATHDQRVVDTCTDTLPLGMP